MMGHWYPVVNNTRLATLEEMREQPAIAGRVWYCPRAHGHEFFHGNAHQIIRPWEDGALVWPESE